MSLPSSYSNARRDCGRAGPVGSAVTSAVLAGLRLTVACWRHRPSARRSGRTAASRCVGLSVSRTLGQPDSRSAGLSVSRTLGQPPRPAQERCPPDVPDTLTSVAYPSWAHRCLYRRSPRPGTELMTNARTAPRRGSRGYALSLRPRLAGPVLAPAVCGLVGSLLVLVTAGRAPD